VDLRRLRAGEWLLATAAAAAVVALFLPWYTRAVYCVRAPCPQSRETGWEALAVVDVLLAAGALAALGVVLLTAASASPSPSIAAEALLTLLCFAVFAVVLGRVLVVPDGAGDRLGGQWLGLASALALWVGASLAMRDERPSRPGRPTDPTGVPVEVAPEVEVLPAPPRGAVS